MYVQRCAGTLVTMTAPDAIPGWDGLARDRSFYLSAGWLRFADSDNVARSRYLGLTVDGRLVAALSSHRAAEEIDPGYVAARTLELTPPAPAEGVLTLGGRRGFLSGALVAPGADRAAAAGHLAELIGHAADGPWWWPYLAGADADLLATGPARPGVHLVGADCVIDVTGTTLEDHVAALPTQQRRTNFRREAQRFAGSRLEIRPITLAGHWPRLGALLAAVQRKYGHPQSAAEMGQRLRRQGERLASRAVVFGCFDGADLIGFALAYEWGGELALRVVGFDYERLPGADEYAQLAVHAPLRYCYAHGLRRLHLGVGSYAAKCRRGARARPLWAVTSLPAMDRDGLDRAVRRLTAAMPAHESASFGACAGQAWERWR